MNKDLEAHKNQRITIITVVRNGEKTIEDTIRSVIKFKDKYNLEFIIIDGKSSDDTVKIIQRYGKNISFLLSEPDQGIYDAMNKGWKIAQDSYILYLGSGDKIISLPEKIPIYKGQNIAYFGKVKIGERYYNCKFNSMIRFGNTLHHQALLIHKNASEVEPFNTKYKIYGDYDFNARLFVKKIKFLELKNFECYALPDGVSSKVSLKEILDIIRKNFGLIWIPFAIIYHLMQGFKYGFDQYDFK